MGFYLSKDLKSNVIFALPAAIIMLFAFLIILPAVPEKTFAEGDNPNEGIVITISPEINASLLSSEDGDYKIIKDTVTIGTDALNGYTLYISTDTPEHQTLYLNGDTASDNKISGANGTYESPKALGDYEWGFAVPGVGHFDASYDTETPSDTAKFAILPTENKIIRDYTASTSEDAAEVYYGFKLGGTIEPGDYETNITYTAIPATQPLTAKAVLGSNGNLNFLYDRNAYEEGATYSYKVTGTDSVETTITKIYTVPTHSTSVNSVGWTSNNNVKSANLDPSFFNFKPASTAYWFYGDYYLASITNANNLNTSQVTDMRSMFFRAGLDASTFVLDLSSWDTSQVTDMSNMFYCYYSSGNSSRTCRANTWSIGDIGSWDVGNVTNMYQMFYYAGYNASVFDLGDLSNWNTSNVTNMSYMFSRAGRSAARTWRIGTLSNWKTSKVTTMSNMFSYAGYNIKSLQLNLSGWDTSSVTSMYRMFYYAGYNVLKTFNLGNIGNWDTSKVTSMNAMFYETAPNAEIWSIGTLDNWNTSSVTGTGMYQMFYSAGHRAAIFNLGNLNNWDTSKVTSMYQMFYCAGYSATTWNIGNLSNWKTGNVTTMYQMFYNVGRKTTTFNLGNLNDWDTSKVTSMNGMFYNAGYSATTWNIGDISSWTVSNVTNYSEFVNKENNNTTIQTNADLPGSWTFDNI